MTMERMYSVQMHYQQYTVSATQRHPAYSHVPQRLARPWHFSKTIKKCGN